MRATSRPIDEADLQAWIDGRLTPERTVEIKLLDPPNTQIRLFHNGGLTRCSHQPIRQHMTILGGDSKSGDPWFVVVRRDKPLDAD